MDDKIKIVIQQAQSSFLKRVLSMMPSLKEGLLPSSSPSFSNFSLIWSATFSNSSWMLMFSFALVSMSSMPQLLANLVASLRVTWRSLSLQSHLLPTMIFVMVSGWLSLTCFIQFDKFSKVFLSVTEYTNITPAAPLQYDYVMVLKRSWPAVSQICILILSPSMGSILTLKSTPIVVTWLILYSSLTKRSRMLVLPTALSPIITNFTMQSQRYSLLFTSINRYYIHFGHRPQPNTLCQLLRLLSLLNQLNFTPNQAQATDQTKKNQQKIQSLNLFRSVFVSPRENQINFSPIFQPYHLQRIIYQAQNDNILSSPESSSTLDFCIPSSLYFLPTSNRTGKTSIQTTVSTAVICGFLTGGSSIILQMPALYLTSQLISKQSVSEDSGGVSRWEGVEIVGFLIVWSGAGPVRSFFRTFIGLFINLLVILYLVYKVKYILSYCDEEASQEIKVDRLDLGIYNNRLQFEMKRQYAKPPTLEPFTPDFPLQTHNKKPNYPLYPSPMKQQPKQFPHTSKETVQVLQGHQYSKLEAVLSSKLKNIAENISICREKNHLKDKEVQSNLTQIDKLELKITKLEHKLTKRDKALHNLSIRCKDLNDSIGGYEEKVKGEMIYQHEEEKKCQAIQEQIAAIQRDIKSAQVELERREKLSESLQQKEEEQENLRQKLTALQNSQKMIEYQANSEKTECQELQKKVENLKKVLKDRSSINKANAGRLAKLNKQIHTIESFVKNKQSSATEIKALELQLGELNQQLLLINEDISELNFKLLRKKQTVAQLRTKIEGSRMLTSTLTNQTPTFPSKELHSQQQTRNEQEEPPNPNDALKNIELLINRYERIKTKDEHKY